MAKEGVYYMRKQISKEVLFNRQVNYIIIEKMWEHINKKADKDKLYKLLGLNKNVYSRIRKADDYNIVDLEKKWEQNNSRLKILGLSKEIMTGIEMIEIDGVEKAEWEKYIYYRYDIEEKQKKEFVRTSDMQAFNKKLKMIFDEIVLDKATTSDIGKILYFVTYGRAVVLDIPDAEMVDLLDSLKKVTVEKMKVCDKELREKIYKTMKEKWSQMDTIIKYEKLE